MYLCHLRGLRGLLSEGLSIFSITCILPLVIAGKAAFLNGQTMYNLNGAPLTKDQQDLFKFVLNGARVTSPYMLLLASLAVIATLFSL
eukprot:scaffold67224_cov21-Tisochrysis_lutea.AAC.1